MLDPKLRIDPDGSSYRKLGQVNDFAHDTGLVVLPVAGRTAAHRVIRLHGGYGLRTVRWQAARSGVPPLIPAATDTEGDTLLTSVVSPHMPVFNPNSRGYDFAVTGEYTYVQNEPRVAGVNALPCGDYPFVIASVSNAAWDLVGRYVSSILSNDAITNKMDGVTERAAELLRTYPDGITLWPLPVLPAAMTSTHIIGG